MREFELVVGIVGLALWRVEPEIAGRWPFGRVAELTVIRLAERGGVVEGRDEIRALLVDVLDGILAVEQLDSGELEVEVPDRLPDGWGS